MDDEIAGVDSVSPEVLDRHWAANTTEDTDDGDDESGEPLEPEADDDDEPDPDEDTSDDDAEPEDEDTDTSEDDEAGDDEDPDDEDGEDDEEEEEEEEDDDFLRVTKEERERIESDPALRKLHRSMQKHFTQATQAAASARREAENIKGELDEFLTRLSSDDGAEEFLLEIALERMDVFERAYERATELTDDPDEKQRYEKERNLARREREIERRDKAEQAEAINARAEQIISTMTRYANAAGLTDMADLELLDRVVAARIAENERATGKREITDAEIQAEVKLIARAAKTKESRIRDKAAKERTGKDLERVKRKARDSKRTPPPRSTSSPGAKSRKSPPLPEGVDPVAHRINQLLGI